MPEIPKMEYNIIDSIDKGIEDKVSQRISFHSNRLCMLSLPDNHPAMAKNIVKVNCKISDKLSRLNNTVSGKGKKGAQKLEPSSIVCYIETEDNCSYPIYSCIKGKLLEINAALVDKPNLIKEQPVSNGYIALLLPDLKYYQQARDKMLDETAYLEYIAAAVKTD